MSRINVCLRIRPFFPNELSAQSIVSIPPKSSNDYPTITLIHPSQSHVRSFQFDEIFSQDVTQKGIYERIGQGILARVMEGYNGTLMAYGQTNSGKSFTMGFLGDLGRENDGLVQRCIRDVFDMKQRREQAQEEGHQNEDNEEGLGRDEQETIQISMDFVQIYLEKIQDLLNPEDSNLTVREGRDGTVSIPNLTRVDVNTVDEALEHLKQGLDNRIMAPTLMNTTSSRSHTILSIHVRRRMQDRTVEATLRICDLAGSERITRSGSSGLRLDEAKCINKSLSTLGVVISALAQKKSKKHIPFRDSKLTRLLKPVLGTGNSNTVLIATIAPTHWSYSETLSTLQFGQRCMHVETHAVLNEREEIDYKSLTMRLQDQLRELQAQQFLTHSSPSHKSGTSAGGLMNGGDSFSPRNALLEGGASTDDHYNRMGWGMCNALHDSLHKLYEVSRTGLEDARDRSLHMEDLWTPKNRIDENTNLNNPHLRRIAIVNEAMNQIRSQYSTAVPFVTISKQPIKKLYYSDCTMEEYTGQVSHLFHSTYSYIDQLKTILKKRDEQIENLKRELAKHVVDEINFAINGAGAHPNGAEQPRGGDSLQQGKDGESR